METHSDKVWTYDDLATLPDDGQRYEIIDGELFVSPSLATLHQRALKRLVREILKLEDQKVAEIWFAPLDVVLSPTCVVEPDLFVIRSGRHSAYTKKAIVEAPDLVVKVLSPGTAKHDRTRKRRFYAHAGIREYWLVDPEAESIEVLVLGDGALTYRTAQWAGPGDTVCSTLFDVAIDVDTIFHVDPEVAEAEAVLSRFVSRLGERAERDEEDDE